MNGDRPALFRGRHFADDVIVRCVRWYLRYSLSYRDLAEMMVERHLSVDPSTIWRWVQRYAPELNERIRHELKPTNGSWRTDETYVRVAGRWTYLYRAVDSTGATIDFFLSETRDVFAAGAFFRKALVAPGRPHPRVINVDRNPSYPRVIDELKRTHALGNDVAVASSLTSTTLSSRITVRSNGGSGRASVSALSRARSEQSKATKHAHDPQRTSPMAGKGRRC
jgi:transposase, IS6 family